MPTAWGNSIASASAARRGAGRWARIVSTSWSPIEKTGLSAARGSCITSATSRPRTRLNASLSFGSRSWPLRRIRSARTSPGGSINPSTLSRVSDFPDPDSPTIAKRWPGKTVKSTPSTTVTGPSAPGKRTESPRTSKIGASTDADTGIDPDAGQIGQQIQNEDEKRPQEHGRHQQRDVGALHCLVGRQAQAGPSKDRFHQDRAAEKDPEVDGHHGQNGADRGAKNVLAEDGAGGDSARSQSLDELAVQGLQRG